jgi:hypothetical protein
MSNFTLVVEGNNDAMLLKRVIKDKLGFEPRCFSAQGRMSISTLLRNVIVHEGGPLLAVIDADTADAMASQERISLIRAAVQPVVSGDQVAVFAFLPELEVVFVEAPAVLQRYVGAPPPGEVWNDFGNSAPKRFLQRIIGANESHFIAALTPDDIETISMGTQMSNFIEAAKKLNTANEAAK